MGMWRVCPEVQLKRGVRLRTNFRGDLVVCVSSMAMAMASCYSSGNYTGAAELST